MVTSVGCVSDSRTNSTTTTRTAALHEAARVARVDAAGLQKLQTATSSWYHNFWNKSSIALPSDPRLGEDWHKGLYGLASCSRAGKFAPGLWGNWVTTDVSMWHGDYTRNYNMEVSPISLLRFPSSGFVAQVSVFVAVVLALNRHSTAF